MTTRPAVNLRSENSMSVLEKVKSYVGVYGPTDVRSMLHIDQLLDHHIKEEEDDLFEELGEHFSDAQRERMGRDFATRKSAFLARAAA